MSDGQLCHRALVDANRRIAELERHMANVQQRAREAVLGSATALREAELMRDSHFANLQRIPKLWIRFVPQIVNRRVENRADEVAIGTPDTAGRSWSGNGDTMRRAVGRRR